ncbi:MAG: DUF2892 domain-containing protein [Bacteroidales bacterium]
MKKNTGKLDRIIRLIIALLIGILYFTNVISGTLGIVLLVFAVILLITSITGFCGIYTLLGINTCKTRV